MNNLITEAKNLIDQLDNLLYSCYGWNPVLQEDIAKAGTAAQRQRINRIRTKAQQRLNRRLVSNGTPPPIRGLGGLINSLDSSWF